jgi:hypothetical protein
MVEIENMFNEGDLLKFIGKGGEKPVPCEENR